MRSSAQITQASRRLVALTLLLVLSVHGRSPAQAGDYPDHVVKIVVPFPAGGTADAIPRIVAERLSRKWNQPVIIENRTGAAGNIGAEQVYHSPPDGYTLLSSPPPPLVINQNLYPKEVRTDPGDGAGAECADRQSEQRQGVEPERVDRISA